MLKKRELLRLLGIILCFVMVIMLSEGCSVPSSSSPVEVSNETILVESNMWQSDSRDIINNPNSHASFKVSDKVAHITGFAKISFDQTNINSYSQLVVDIFPLNKVTVDVTLYSGSSNLTFRNIHPPEGNDRFILQSWNRVLLNLNDYRVEKNGYLDPLKIDGVSIDVKKGSIYLGDITLTRSTLQEGAVVFSFDDGYLSTYAEAGSLNKGVVFVSGKFVENNVVKARAIDSRPALTIWHLKQLASKGWDISNHTRDHVRYPKQYDIKAGLVWLLDNELEPGGQFFAYPYYAISEESRNAAAAYSKLARAGESYWTRTFTWLPVDPHTLPSYTITEDVNLSELIHLLKVVRYNKHVLILVFHDIGYDDTSWGYVTPEKFEQVVNTVNTYGVRISTLSELYNH
jgi:peptidoglycan/xylan/chitin deacetylase (PgdA/CDA1 family)